MDHLQQAMRLCRLCYEQGFEIEPGAIFSGKQSAQVMVIGQAPGMTEVQAKRPFNAGSGNRLFRWLKAAGWDESVFRQRHYMTAVTKCFPGKKSNGRGDRVPSLDEQRLCRPFLEDELSLVAPRLIIPIGGLAIRHFYPSKAKLRSVIGTAALFSVEAPLTLEDLHVSDGLIASSIADEPQEDQRWIVPLPHPSGASLWPNDPKNQALIDRAIDLLAQIRVAYSL